MRENLHRFFRAARGAGVRVSPAESIDAMRAVASVGLSDRHILRELQDNGRITNVELARRVGISAPPCLRRVRALEEAGYIKGYRALLDEKLLGYEVTVFAMVHLSSQAEADLSAFEGFVRAQPIVRETSRSSNNSSRPWPSSPTSRLRRPLHAPAASTSAVSSASLICVR